MTVEDRLPLLLTVALALRAGRARLGLSQRGLAESAGLSKSAVARLEKAEGPLTLQVAGSALAAVGLRLTVTDEAGTVWNEPDHGLSIDQENLRDLGGRRYPAHLEVYEPHLEPTWRFTRRMKRSRHDRRVNLLRGAPMYRLAGPVPRRIRAQQDLSLKR